MASLLLSATYGFHLAFRVALTLRAFEPNAAPPQSFRNSATVIQPILGGDPGLARALGDNLQELPMAKFVWLVDREDVDGLAVANRLSAQHPDRVRVLACPQPPEGVNPKLFKLERAWREIETPALIVLDDDTRLPARTLASLIEALNSADLSTALPFYRAEGNFPTRLLAQFVNNSAALTYLPMLAFGPPLSVNGMAYAIRVDTLERCGGFEPILGHLTDDLAIARHVRASAGTIRQVSAPVQVETNVDGLPGYVRQMHRWFLFALLLARDETLTTQCRLGLLLGIHPLLLWGALLTGAGGGFLSLTLLAATLVARGVALAWLQARLTGRARHQPALSLLSELLQPLHLLHAALSPNIQWRSRRYRVYANDRFVSR